MSRSAERGRRRGKTPRRGFSPRTLVPQLLVVAVLVGGTTAFVHYDKTVTVVVDGEEQKVRTFASSVDEVLSRQQIDVGEHDTVAPAKNSELDDGDRVAVRYGRLLDLTLDGQPQQVWVTATSVGEAMDQLGVRTDGAYLSKDRAVPIGRAGLALDVRTERGITFMIDGGQVPLRTNVATVGEALTQAGVELGPQDRVSVPPETYPTDGMTVSIVRVTGTTVVKDERIPFETKREDDPEEFEGKEVVETKGVPGLRRVTWTYDTVDGVAQEPRKVSEEIVRKPVTQVIKVGTKEKPEPEEEKEDDTGGSGDGLNWEALAQCEAGGRPNAVDPSGTYHGLYQFDARTWQSMGGTGVASTASASEQTSRAKMLFAQRGASPWPICGSKLYS
ncbi:ubiquitin-like domain-containing protein [Yinghuangia sp. ASG 101]|uniref:resuscitation-promoting factor n=1 Tax=Yinghuangia sp. ASG 101 TaxID=2896848 RepID=UPI001E4A0EBE|nr:resuscitation-promoting factor [Yinghuangia sp. ASG 101]UGQ09336.1 ubiquitin-like domain-containing protein [Yinghuangia sp. ASG 101]